MMMFFTIGILAGFLILTCVGVVWLLWHLLPMACRLAVVLGVGAWVILSSMVRGFVAGCREAHAENKAAKARQRTIKAVSRQPAKPGWIDRGNAWVDRANARLDARIAARLQKRA